MQYLDVYNGGSQLRPGVLNTFPDPTQSPLDMQHVTFYSIQRTGLNRLWNATGKIVATFKGHIGRVNTFAFSLDGKTLGQRYGGRRPIVGRALADRATGMAEDGTLND